LCLLIDQRVEVLTSQKHFYISASSQPFIRLLCHNRQRGLRAGAKATKAVAPHWRIDLVVRVKVTDIAQHKLECKEGTRSTTEPSLFLWRYFHKVAALNSTKLYVNRSSSILPNCHQQPTQPIHQL
jgi:hypothetical protein